MEMFLSQISSETGRWSERRSPRAWLHVLAFCWIGWWAPGSVKPSFFYRSIEHTQIYISHLKGNQKCASCCWRPVQKPTTRTRSKGLKVTSVPNIILMNISLFWQLQDSSCNGCLCREPPLCLCDQQPCAKGECALLHKVGIFCNPTKRFTKVWNCCPQKAAVWGAAQVVFRAGQASSQPSHEHEHTPCQVRYGKIWFFKSWLFTFTFLFLQNSLALPSQSLSVGEDHKCEEGPRVDVWPRVQEPDRCEWGGTVTCTIYTFCTKPMKGGIFIVVNRWWAWSTT